MKHSLLIVLTFMSIFMSSASSCNKEDDKINTENNTPMANCKIKIKINSQTFTATLLDNSSAKAFKELLPLTINMIELNGNEKYYDLSNSLPTNSSNPGTIKNGDLMLYGSKTLVLFYKTFSTSYSYTKLGTIDDVTVLTTALGSGNVTVTFELE
ncbi:MAG: cyclophilin-like fold protein [Bacteroidota bacterium]|nr:cyclophilin-like fold protein [Bacteroidota bacterium]